MRILSAGDANDLGVNHLIRIVAKPVTGDDLYLLNLSDAHASV